MVGSGTRNPQWMPISGGGISSCLIRSVLRGNSHRVWRVPEEYLESARTVSRGYSWHVWRVQVASLEGTVCAFPGISSACFQDYPQQSSGRGLQ